MPAYNEEESIAAAVAEVVTECLDAVPGSELVVVDDGSRDRTADIVLEIAASEPRVTLVHKRNGGHGPALVEGIKRAQGGWLLLVDSDRQIPLDGFRSAWASRAGKDAVLGRRARRVDSTVRRFVTTSLRTILRVALGARLADANAPFKLLRRPVWQDSRRFIADDCPIPSVFLAVCIQRHGWRYDTVAVGHRPRVGGTGSLLGWKLISFCSRATIQLLRLSVQLALIRSKPADVEALAEAW
ncbi:MAG TPA: glycosyltransferase family 2 protein [Candidatus Dormibacteraeota bacterium]